MRQTSMFETEDLPLFSGTATKVIENHFEEKEIEKQYNLPLGCPLCMGTGRVDEHDCVCGYGMRLKVIRECAGIADGTLASITGLTRYTDLDNLRNQWLDWVECQDVIFANWQAAWEAWQTFLEKEPD